MQANAIERRPPPSQCTICFELLLRYERDETHPDGYVLSPIVALKCGHLLHTKCTILYFQSQGSTECDELKNCPYCERKNRWCDMRRILLTQSPSDEMPPKKTDDSEMLIDLSSSMESITEEECPRPTPSLCTICHDYLLDYEDAEKETLRPIVALKCGHLLHTECNNKWFLFQQGSDDDELKECAYCRRKNRWCDTIRILLTLSRPSTEE